MFVRFFFLQHGHKDLCGRTNFWIYVFKEHTGKSKRVVKGKQGQTCKQTIFVFFICSGFKIWLLGERLDSQDFWIKKSRTFSKQHFPGFSFTQSMLFQGVCVFISMSVRVYVCGQACVCLCVYRRQAWGSCHGNKSSSAI